MQTSLSSPAFFIESYDLLYIWLWYENNSACLKGIVEFQLNEICSVMTYTVISASLNEIKRNY